MTGKVLHEEPFGKHRRKEMSKKKRKSTRSPKPRREPLAPGKDEPARNLSLSSFPGAPEDRHHRPRAPGVAAGTPMGWLARARPRPHCASGDIQDRTTDRSASPAVPRVENSQEQARTAPRKPQRFPGLAKLAPVQARIVQLQRFLAA